MSKRLKAETTKKTPTIPVGALVPQPNGRGALRNGGTNKGGTGRPPSELRAKMRGSLATRIKIAEKIADSDDSSDSDRLRALDFLARYGLGTQNDVKLEATHKIGVVVLPTLSAE